MLLNFICGLLAIALCVVALRVLMNDCGFTEPDPDEDIPYNLDDHELALAGE